MRSLKHGMSGVANSLGVAAIAVALVTGSAAANAPVGRYSIADAIVLDTKTTLSWQRTVPTAIFSWPDAKAYCASLGQGASPEQTGWRLPTVKELQTLVDRSQASAPSIDPSAFPGTPPAFFWSSTLLAGSPSYAWSVNFASGGTGNLDEAETSYVRCVR
jgi:hypothetical protein